MGDAHSPATVARYRVPRGVLAASAEALRRLSNGRIESIVLWQGRVQSERDAEVRELVVPKQIAGRLHFNVPLDERMRLIDVVLAAGDIILAQLHTHPNESRISPGTGMAICERPRSIGTLARPDGSSSRRGPSGVYSR
jgi:hypothetical protein